MSLQGVGGKSLAVVTLGHDKFARADAFRFLDEQDAAEKIRLRVEPTEAAHVGQIITAAKMLGAHGQILPATLMICTREPLRIIECSLWNLGTKSLDIVRIYL